VADRFSAQKGEVACQYQSMDVKAHHRTYGLTVVDNPEYVAQAKLDENGLRKSTRHDSKNLYSVVYVHSKHICTDPLSLIAFRW
jgi:hypothetical protein